MKKILFSLFLVIISLSCTNKPEETVSKFINKIKEKKIVEAEKLSLNAEFKDNFNLKYDNNIQQLLFEKLFENIDYKIEKIEKIDKKTSIVHVTIENINTKKVFLIIFSKMFQETYFSSGKTLSIEDEFKKILESDNLPKEKNITQFKVVKTNRGNKIELTSDNIDVLFGKLNTTLMNLNNLGTDENDITKENHKGASNIENQQKLVEPKKLENK